jgi:outer membrane lipoprotein-sorting protein
MFLTNPAGVFISISDSFRQNAVNSSDDGKSLNYSLTPKAAKDIQYLNIEIDKVTETIRNMSFALEDGTLVKIKVSSMKLTPKISDEAFRPQIKFDSKWIVTDLR